MDELFLGDFQQEHASFQGLRTGGFRDLAQFQNGSMFLLATTGIRRFTWQSSLEKLNNSCTGKPKVGVKYHKVALQQ